MIWFFVIAFFMCRRFSVVTSTSILSVWHKPIHSPMRAICSVVSMVTQLSPALVRLSPTTLERLAPRAKDPRDLFKVPPHVAEVAPEQCRHVSATETDIS